MTCGDFRPTPLHEKMFPVHSGSSARMWKRFGFHGDDDSFAGFRRSKQGPASASPMHRLSVIASDPRTSAASCHSTVSTKKDGQHSFVLRQVSLVPR